MSTVSNTYIIVVDEDRQEYAIYDNIVSIERARAAIDQHRTNGRHLSRKEIKAASQQEVEQQASILYPEYHHVNSVLS